MTARAFNVCRRTIELDWCPIAARSLQIYSLSFRAPANG